MKIALKIISLLIVLVAAASAALVFIGVPSGAINALLADRLTRGSDMTIRFDGATRIGLFPLHLTIHDVTLSPSGDDKTRIAIERIEVDIPLASLLSREPTASLVTVTRPVLHAPLMRERARATPSATNAPAAARRIPVERVIVTDGGVVMSDSVARVEQRIDGIAADVQIFTDRRIALRGSARLGNASAAFSATTQLATGSDRQPVPFEFSFDAPGVMQRSISAVGDVKIAGTLVSLSNLSGRFGDEAFNGYGTADLASKPVLKLDLDFPHLSFDAPQWRENKGDRSGWSTVPFDFDGLNYADAQAKLSVAELKVGTLRVIPAALEVTLASGALKVQAAKLGVTGGTIDGEVVIDASGPTPDLSLRADIANVRARPLLSSLAGFDKIDGKLTAKIGLRGTGANPRALAATVGGTAFTAVADGEIVGVNLAQMIRTLTGTTLSGWQQDAAATTDLSQLSASFRLEGGQGSTSDLVLSGPLVRMTGAGNIDLVSETMAFRVEPKLVMTLQGQAKPGTSAAPTPVGLGVPVIVQGPWAAPRIYPEISGILDNPDAAYSQLRQMGQGLFGRDLLGKDLQGLIGPGSGGGADGQNIGQAIGNIMQGFGGSQKPAAATPSPAGPSASPPPVPDANAPSPMNDIMKRLFGR